MFSVNSACEPEIVVVPDAMYIAPPCCVASFGVESKAVLNVTPAPSVSPDDEYIAPPLEAAFFVNEAPESVTLPPVTEIAPPASELLS